MTGSELFKSGLNCSQSVFCALSEGLGFDINAAKSVALGFGGGMARTRGVCGCVSGALMAAGVYCSNNGLGKNECYALGQKFIEAFKKENGSIICGELLSMGGAPKAAEDHTSLSGERTAEYYKKRPCPALCDNAVELFNKVVQEGGE